MLARFSSWGAIPDVFDESKPSWSTERALLRGLLDEEQWAQARRTTINAHYTDPGYVRQMWGLLGELGFTRGRVLEPGAGAGTFIGMAPDTAEMTGVELDRTSAAIAAALYPQAEVRAESFADTRYPDGFFDATIGNVPFGDVVLHDPRHNPGRHSLHNHFIIKSLQLTRPGGLVAVLTSRYTLDGQNPAARREMSQLADLVGAIRLPSGAHRRAAGTEVVTDLLVFRRREPGEPAGSQVWETVTARQVDGEIIRVNSYFDTRPEHILGELAVGPGQFGAATLHVRADLADVETRLATALAGVAADAREHGQLMTARSAASQTRLDAYVPAEAGLWDGTILAGADGSFTVVQDGAQQPLTVPKSAAAELRSLLQLRDGARALLEAEAATRDDSPDLEDARTALRARFDAYQARYGAINRYTLRDTGRVDPDTGEPGKARITPTAVRILRKDPFAPVVKALELFDEQTQTGLPAAMLQRRVVASRPDVLGVDTPAEAVAVSMDRTGRIDLDLIGHLLGTSPAEAREALGEMVYDDPADGRLVTAAEYLSGDIRDKLDVAAAAAADDPRYQQNVAALTAVLPTPLGMEEISARMGAVWIDRATHQQFLREILRDSSVTVENPVPGTWTVKGNRRSILATNEWGTERRCAIDVAQAVMEQRDLVVHDQVEHGDSTRPVVNPLETQAATEKAEKMQERFAEWVWEDPERAARLTDEYNRRFNSIVLRDYSTAGEYLTFPGMAASFTPRPHQRAAVARMIAEPAVGLFHEVGAGKTAEIVIGASELKRMGLIGKPVVVVPNHMLEQFGREWLQIYPQAKILAASSQDLAGDARRLFVARAAANDWDAIIMTRTAFERIPVSPEIEARYIQDSVDELRAALDASDGENRFSVKQLERRLLKLEQKQTALLDRPRDPGISFEATGIDYVIVDEMHDYKNLGTVSNIAGASIEGSGKATDLHLKFEALRQRHGLRVGTVATATPIANSVTEAHVMQRYLRPDLLAKAGVLNFDAWAATFGQTVTEMEMAPTGGGNFRLKTRFARFQNVPEMLKMWHVFADVKTADDLGLPVPELAARPDGRRAPETVAIPPTPALEAYLEQIASRAEAVADKSVTPDEDNMLWIATDGRKAALDMRLVGEPTAQAGTKLQVVAERILDTWHRTRDLEYTDPETGQPSPVRGALQIVFSDLGTPKQGGEWDAYNELKRLLVAGGMPPAGIQLIHHAKTDADKGRLFAAARAGHVAVLMGSTGKMGTGANVQTRAIALHNVDCPWRPADVQQRNGRIVRQKNQNPEVTITNYVVEGSFDAYMWQTVERKAKFIAQVMRGRLDVREMEDIGDFALSAAEAKALSSGNPLLLEQAKVNDELQKLQRLERAHHRAQDTLAHTRDTATRRAATAEANIATLQAALPKAIATDGDAFRAEIRGDLFTKRADAADAITRWAHRTHLGALSAYSSQSLGELGSLGGFTIDMRATSELGKGPMVAAELRGVPTATILIPRESLLERNAGVVTRLENLTASLPKLLAEQQATLTEARTTIADADARIGQPFKHADALRAARERKDSIDAQLAAHANPDPAPTPPGPDVQQHLAGARASLDAIAARRADRDPDQPGPAVPDWSPAEPSVQPTRSPRLS